MNSRSMLHACINGFAKNRSLHQISFRKLEKAVAVQNSLGQGFSGKFRRCWKTLPDFPAARNAIYPCQRLGTIRQRLGTIRQGRHGCWNLPPPSGTLLDFSPQCPNVGRDSISRCRKIGKSLPAASRFAGEPFRQGISDSHSLLKLSERYLVQTKILLKTIIRMMHALRIHY